MSEDKSTDNGKIVIPWKWHEEEGEDTIDLNNPNDIEKLSRKWNQAHGYEKGQIELKAVKNEKEQAEQQVEYWNGLIEEAQQSGDTSKVVGALASAGVKLNKDEDDEVVLDAGDQKVQELAKEIESLKNGMYNNWANDTHSQLEAKYSDGNYPEYNRKEIEDYANKKGIRDFEDAYFVMNKDDIMKVQAKANNDKGKKHADKIRNVASKEPGSGTIPAKPIEKHADYGKATAGWKTDPGVTDNLFIDES